MHLPIIPWMNMTFWDNLTTILPIDEFVMCELCDLSNVTVYDYHLLSLMIDQEFVQRPASRPDPSLWVYGITLRCSRPRPAWYPARGPKQKKATLLYYPQIKITLTPRLSSHGDWIECGTLVYHIVGVGRALQPTLVTSKKKKKKEREKKERENKKNKARMWRPMSRGYPVRANGIALEGWVEM